MSVLECLRAMCSDTVVYKCIKRRDIEMQGSYFGKYCCIEYLIPNKRFRMSYWVIPKGNKVLIDIKYRMLL